MSSPPLTAARQLLLDVHPAPSLPSFDNFISGHNQELLARLKTLRDPGNFDQIYLWSEAGSGSGRSHLLKAVLHDGTERPVIFMAASELEDELAPAPGSLIIIDDIDQLNETAQITLFRIFNTARLAGLALLLAGNAPPRQLQLREDLRTRVGATLVFEVHALDEAARRDALYRHARRHGLSLDEQLINYLLHHGRRDLPTLIKTLEAADQLSLRLKRPLTLPLLREVLQQQTPAR